MSAFVQFLFLPLGIILLLKGADYLVDGASSLAKRFKVPTLVVGLTIVAFGTSTPELLVNIMAAVQKSGGVAFGNIIGSNMANILLILGMCAVITGIKVHRSTVWKEIPFSFLATMVLLVFASIPFLDNISSENLTRSQGIILLFFFAIFLYYVISMTRKNRANLDDEKIIVKEYKTSTTVLLILGGFLGLYLGGVWTVDGAIFVARHFGLSEFFISSTIIAIGTSLPELFTSVKAMMKGNADLAVGNIVGSNIFNIFWVLGVTAIIYPIKLPSFAIVDIILLAFASILLFGFMFIGKKHEIEKWQGFLFLALYVGYLIFLFYRG